MDVIAYYGCDVSGDESAGLRLQAALLSMIGKPAKEYVSIDFGAKMAELGLASVFPAEVHDCMSLGA